MRGPGWYRSKAGHRDANHAAIRDALRKLGHFVVDCAGVGDGVPDLCAYPRSTWLEMDAEHHVQTLESFMAPVWLELKVQKGKIRKSQEQWRTRALNAGIRVATVRTLDEALAALR